MFLAVDQGKRIELEPESFPVLRIWIWKSREGKAAIIYRGQHQTGKSSKEKESQRPVESPLQGFN